MAGIFCVTSGMPGILYAGVELARRLAADGHRVSLAAVADARELAEYHGLGFLPLEPDRYERFQAADARAGTLARIRDLRGRQARAREALAAGSFARAVRRAAPDLVLVDGEMHEHVFAAVSAGAKVALLNFFVSIWRRPGLPPPHHPVRPGVGWRGSSGGIRLAWLALQLERRRRAWCQRIRWIGCDRLTTLRSLARESGLDLHRELDFGQWLKPFTYRRLPVLCLHALEYEFPHRPPSRVRYVGPMVLESRVDRPLPPEDRRRLDEVFARCRRGGGDRTLIYAGFGSVLSTQPALLRRLIEAVAERPAWELVLSLSGRFAPAALGRLPTRVTAFDWVPQLEALRHADVAVTHGGVNTIDECVVSGVPILVYCGFETDMAGNAARVLHHGLGIAGDRRDGAAAIRGRLDRLLGEPSYRDNVARMRALYAAYAERRVAERAVAELVAAGPATGGGSAAAGSAGS